VDAFVADSGTSRGGLPPYDIANLRVRYSDIRLPVTTGSWRGLGFAPNTFAIESMIDELAHAAGIDALQFRLQNISSAETKVVHVLRRVAALSNWKNVSKSDKGYGLACGVYKGKTAVAVVAKVNVSNEQKRIAVEKIWCVQDCGLVINPHQVESQIIGNIVWGCNMVLKEQITIANSAVKERNFGAYDLLRYDEMPQVSIELVDTPHQAPVGVGESAFGPVAPAITNAIFSITGRRPRRLPINAGDIF
jgi:isoquinoline 1-oxidoreductase beta subunit